MSIDQRLRTFGKNLDVCLSLLGQSHAEIADSTGIGVSKLCELHTGKVFLRDRDLQAIADTLYLSPRYLTQSYPDDERRQEKLAIALLEAGHKITSAVPLPPLPDVYTRDLERLPPPVRKPRAPVLVVARPPIKVIHVPRAPVVLAPPPKTECATLPTLRPAALVRTTKVTTMKRGPKKMKIQNVIAPEDIDPAFIVTFDGVDYNLKDKILRQSIVDRIRFVKGSILNSELTKRLARKRSYAWFNSLRGVTPEEIEDIAQLCSTTAHALVTGEGIVSLAAGEKATTWFMRYVTTASNGTEVQAAAEAILKDLERWSPALRFMLVKYLQERV